MLKLKYLVGTCDIDFFNFHHCQVQNFEILNLLEQNQNFAVNFWKYQQQNQKSTKYIVTEWKQRIISIQFCEILLVLWNVINFWKILQFLIKFFKSLKDSKKILLKWFGKTVKYQLNFVNYCSCHEK
jgi:hypothetical protein